jgi:hypothetical protein
MIAVAVPILTGVNEGVNMVITEAVPVAVDVNDGISVGLTVAVPVAVGVNDGVSVGLTVAVPVAVGVNDGVSVGLTVAVPVIIGVGDGVSVAVTVTVGNTGVGETGMLVGDGTLVYLGAFDFGAFVGPGVLLDVAGCMVPAVVNSSDPDITVGVSVRGSAVQVPGEGVILFPSGVRVPGFVGSGVGVGVGVAGLIRIARLR